MLIGKLGTVQHDQLYRFNIRALSRDTYSSEAGVLMYCIKRNFIAKLEVIQEKNFNINLNMGVGGRGEETIRRKDYCFF